MSSLSDPIAIKEEIGRLKTLLRKYEELLGIIEGKEVPSVSIRVKPFRLTLKRKGRRRGKKNTRQAQVEKLLKQEGPLFRKEIIAKTGIPTGSVGMVLKESNGFEKHSDGRWGIPAKAA